MITHVSRADILSDKSEVLVCPTNAVGVMGAGLAKQFREQFCGLFLPYREHCNAHDKNDLVPFVWVNEKTKQFVYCLHTKRHYRESSTISNVEFGLQQLVKWCQQHDIKTIALPALGCGLGGLHFDRDVKPLMEKYLNDLPMDVYIYIPLKTINHLEK